MLLSTTYWENYINSKNLVHSKFNTRTLLPISMSNNLHGALNCENSGGGGNSKSLFWQFKLSPEEKRIFETTLSGFVSNLSRNNANIFKCWAANKTKKGAIFSSSYFACATPPSHENNTIHRRHTRNISINCSKKMYEISTQHLG